MTDPTGRSFLSYCRKRHDEAELLIRAQREMGIPTWQDIEDLGEGQTETNLRDVLSAEDTANAILWLTPEVADSDMIRRVEVPAMVRRQARDDGFFILPVAAGGLDYAEAAKPLAGKASLHDLRSWNLQRISNTTLDSSEARRIADRVLRGRLASIHDRLPADEPLRIRLMTRRKPAFEQGWALTLDWSHHFAGGRHAPPGSWNHSLIPALRQVRDAIREVAPGRRVVASGESTLSAATALGSAFLSLDEISLTWQQKSRGTPDQLWNLEAPREASGFQLRQVPRDVRGKNLAVLLSVTDDVSSAFNETKILPKVRAVLDVRPSASEPGAFSQFQITNPGQALDIAMTTIEGIRQARAEYRPQRIHLFMAVPVGLAMLVGQLLNTLGPVQTYEHNDSSAVGRYRRGALLKAGL